MSLTVTVQKGHDFSSGNVTRAALNAGAVPTVAVTGSVGTSELAAGSVTGTELKSSASVDTDRAVTTNHIQDDAVTTAKIVDNAVTLPKLVGYDTLKRGTLIKTGDTAETDTIIPETFVANTASKILIGDGNDLLSLGHEPDDEEDGDTTLNQPKSHVAIGLTAPVDSAQTTGVLLTLKDYAIKVVKLAKNLVAGTATPGIIVYNGSGVASVLASTDVDSSVLTTNTTSTPSFRVLHKKITLLGPSSLAAFGVETDFSTNLGHDRTFVGAHEFGAIPSDFNVYLEATAADKGYASGDRLLIPGSGYGGAGYTASCYADGTNVYLSVNYSLRFSDKRTVAASQAADASFNLTHIVPSKWKVVALVSE